MQKTSSRNVRPWSPGEDAVLLDLFAKGHTAREVGAGLGRSVSAVLCRRTRIHKSDGATLDPKARAARFMAPHWTEEEAKTIERMRAEGRSYQEIGEVLHRTTGSVRQRVKRLRAGKPMAAILHGAPYTAKKPKAQPPGETPPQPRFIRKAPAVVAVAPPPRLRDFDFADERLRLEADRVEYGLYLEVVQRMLGPWPVESLIDLVTGLMTGEPRDVVFRRLARARGCTEAQVLTRWMQMTIPIKDGRGIVSLDGVSVLMGLLRKAKGGENEQLQPMGRGPAHPRPEPEASGRHQGGTDPASPVQGHR